MKIRLLTTALFFLIYLHNTGFTQQGWVTQNTPSTISLCSVFFPNSETGYSTGTDYGSGHFIFIKTTNGGSNWFTQISESGSYKCPLGLFFTNELTGYVTGGDVWLGTPSFIFKTTNGGINWQLNNFPDSTVYRGINFPNNNTGYISGSLGYVMKTTNAGTNWFYLNSGTQDGLPGIYFIDANTGFAVGSNGAIMKTTNGGTSWESKTSNTVLPLRAVQFKNSSTGYITGFNTSSFESILLKTTDSGNNWITILTGNSSTINFMCLFFINPDTGYVACQHGIIKTTNGGSNWTSLEIPPPGITITWFGNPIYFVNEHTGYVSGYNGSSHVILKTTTGGESAFPNPPSLLQGTFLTNPRRVQLNWQDNSIIETGFKIERKLNSDTLWQQYDSVNANITTYLDYSVPGPNIYNYRICACKGLNRSSYTNIISIVVTNIVRLNNVISAEYSLCQNYPNPFNPSTTIKFDIPKTSAVRLSVYDITGREIETLVNEQLATGSYETKWDGSKYASGVYFIHLKINNEPLAIKKMVLAK